MIKTLTKVISGGQTGADRGALEAAKKSNIETGGWAPKGFRTENGPDPSLGELYGLKEHESDDYRLRTLQNILDSDATIIFGTVMNSPGTRLTRRHLKDLKKLNLEIEFGKPRMTSKEVADWILSNKIQTLNVAGNRESVSPKVQAFTELFLLDVVMYVRIEEMLGDES
jgi:hypothetical protein